jgi:hypothetical protein
VVTVGAGGQPTVSWTGSAADSFTVVRAIALNDVIWGVRAVVPDSLASPITVGTVPGNAEPITDSVSTLASGYSYRVWVYRKSGGNLCKDFAR